LRPCSVLGRAARSGRLEGAEFIECSLPQVRVTAGAIDGSVVEQFGLLPLRHDLLANRHSLELAQAESIMPAMQTQPVRSIQEVLAGVVERTTYHNAENGFCVLRVKARGHRDLVTVVGHAATIAAGEWVTASGEWVNDRSHGQQFRARFLRTSPPTSREGIEKYLSSGMIRGVGPVYAKKLVRAFGENVFDIIEATPDRLREVDGIGQVRAASILTAWAEQKAVREIMVFLHSHGVGTARAVRIFKTYGADAIQVMSENPYRLAQDIRGIGFKTADAIAMKLGIDKTATMRVRAGISYALTEAMNEGHCGLPTEELVPLAERLLEVSSDLVHTAIELELGEGSVVAERVGERPVCSWRACIAPSAGSQRG
jgi:exodeoxyribonuclease V alpha subunit